MKAIERHLQHMGQIHPCQDIFLSSRGKQDPPANIKGPTTKHHGTPRKKANNF